MRRCVIFEYLLTDALSSNLQSPSPIVFMLYEEGTGSDRVERVAPDFSGLEF